MSATDRKSDRDAALHFAAGAKVVLFNLLCAVIIFLVVVNIPFSSNFSALRKDLMVTDESEIMRFKPNVREESYVTKNLPGMGEDYSAFVLSTNSEGFRDYDHPLEKPPGSSRVAFVGDSFVFGLGVSQEDTLAVLLEQDLNSGGIGRRYDVMNFGLPGLNFEGMGRLTQTFVVKYRPEVVVYSFICDDVSSTDIITHRRWIHWLEGYIGRVPGWLESVLVAGKMMRYSSDFRMMKAIPGLYRKRVLVVLEYLAEIGDTSGHDLIIVDFCQNGSMASAVTEFNKQRDRPVQLITDFAYEVLDEHYHPTGPSNAKTVQLVAPIVRRLVDKSEDAQR